MVLRLDEEKRRLRPQAKQQRAAAAARAGDAAAKVATRALEGSAVPAGRAVSAYWPKGDELDPRPLMAALDARGHVIGLPVVMRPGAPLSFRRWRPGDHLAPAGFGLREPAAGQDRVIPQVLFVPLLAFDRDGYRLGYGGGFYDRSLAELRSEGAVLAIGLAYAGQEIARVPRGPDDQRLDRIVTETETIEIG
jgi:5-formyltetrahydrofolate cyclo-ligase